MVTIAAENPVPEVPSPAPPNPRTNEDGHVLKSRRRLLAAGIAVAVVGGLGVAASTLNAGAEQIPGASGSTTAAVAPDEAAPPAPADADIPAPTVLPWGERPQRIKKGRAGATSKTLRASGLSAADADTSGADEPKARWAPKGRSNRTAFLKTEQTTVAPPEPAPTTSASAAPGEKKVNYLYNVASQPAETDGVYANVTIARPKLLRGDYHTLAEIALQSADGQQIVEVGWNVDRVVNGDDDPHLFVYRWVNRQPSCYNGCGFVQYSKNIKPGDTLPYDVTKKFGIQYSNGAWWIAYDTEWVGYFPESIWIKEGDVKFNRTGLVQLFGEVAAGKATSCTEMGNGQTADTGTAARFSSITYLNGPPVSLWVRSTYPAYTVAEETSRWFWYGGPILKKDKPDLAEAC